MVSYDDILNNEVSKEDHRIQLCFCFDNYNYEHRPSYLYIKLKDGKIVIAKDMEKRSKMDLVLAKRLELNQFDQNEKKEVEMYT